MILEHLNARFHFLIFFCAVSFGNTIKIQNTELWQTHLHNQFS